MLGWSCGGCCPSQFLLLPPLREDAPSFCFPGTRESWEEGGALRFLTCRDTCLHPVQRKDSWALHPGMCGQARGSRREAEDRPGPTHGSSGPRLAAASWGKIYLQVSAGPRSGRGLVVVGASAEAWGPEGRPANPEVTRTPCLQGALGARGRARLSSWTGCPWLTLGSRAPPGAGAVRGLCRGCRRRAPRGPPRQREHFCSLVSARACLLTCGISGGDGAMLL